MRAEEAGGRKRESGREGKGEGGRRVRWWCSLECGCPPSRCIHFCHTSTSSVLTQHANESINTAGQTHIHTSTNHISMVYMDDKSCVDVNGRVRLECSSRTSAKGTLLRRIPPSPSLRPSCPNYRTGYFFIYHTQLLLLLLQFLSQGRWLKRVQSPPAAFEGGVGEV